jgi:soluble lytic murein transglycosylase-like protein
MQVMPRDGLAAGFVCQNGPCFANRPSIEELEDPAFNVKYGTAMLRNLLDKYGDTREALRYYGPKDSGYYYADKVLGIYTDYRK